MRGRLFHRIPSRIMEVINRRWYHVAGVQPNARRRHGTAPRFPATLCSWVGEIVQSSPEAARLTLLELIVGALLASGGHVTQAVLALTPRLGWHTGCSNGSGCSA